LFDLYVD